MSERADLLDDVVDLDDPTVERPDATGIERVDAVIDAVAGLRPDDEPADQVAVFEQAQGELRRALDDPAAD